MPKTHFRACHLCEAICGLVIETDRDRIVSIRGDEADPLSHGHICPKAVALKDVHEDPDRLRRPLRRTASGWAEVSWDDALAEAAERLVRVQSEHGRNAVAVYQGNPVVHNHGALLFGQVLLRSLGTRSRFSATSVDQLPHMLSSLLMFGHQLLLPVPDVDRTQFFLVLGANPLASNGSLMTAPGIERRLRALRARGGKLVVVDPRRTETAAIADLHLAIRPGTDALLLAALLHTLAAEDRLRPGRLAEFTDGLDAAVAAVKGFAPEAVAEEIAAGMASGELPPFIGIRIKVRVRRFPKVQTHSNCNGKRGQYGVGHVAVISRRCELIERHNPGKEGCLHEVFDRLQCYRHDGTQWQSKEIPKEESYIGGMARALKDKEAPVQKSNRKDQIRST